MAVKAFLVYLYFSGAHWPCIIAPFFIAKSSDLAGSKNRAMLTTIICPSSLLHCALRMWGIPEAAPEMENELNELTLRLSRFPVAY